MSVKAPFIFTLDQLLHYDVCKFTSAEMQLSKSLPDWIQNAHSPKLKEILGDYAKSVDQQLLRMEAFLIEEKISIFSVHIGNRVMEAFIDDTNDKLSKCPDRYVKDACLIASIQEINHYKISAYGSGAAFAQVLIMPRHAALFYECELNEKQMDGKLSRLAEQEINPMAKIQ